MKILILGGTGFLGRHIVAAGVARGHDVAVFNRGNAGDALPTTVRQFRGDRDADDYSSLAGGTWDAVVDTSASIAARVRGSIAALKDSAGHYIFISSRSVYPSDSFGHPDKDETAAMEPWPAGADERDRDMNLYGAQKARCEKIVLDEFGDRAAIVRSGLIVGPGDSTDRFTYWPMRIARGGEVLAPGFPDAPVQFIDARDLAEWIVGMIERRVTGVFNASGPRHEMSMADFLEECRIATGAGATLTWVDQDFLAEQGVRPWSELPLWVPRTPAMAGFSQMSSRKAIDAGLTFRPLAETARATHEWAARAQPADHVWRAGLSAAKESAVLAAWNAQGKGD